MLGRVFFLSMVLVSVAAQPAGADAAFTGLTGLGEMRTPETVGERQQASFGLRYKQVGDEIGRRLTPQLGYIYGITNEMEAGVLLPFNSMEAGSSLGQIPLLYKYRFYDSELLKFAGTAFVDLPTAKKKDFGSGSLGFGAEADGSLSFGDLGLFGSLNYGKGDYCPGCEYGGTQRGVEAVYIPIFKAAGGVAYGDESYRAYAELHFENAANGVPIGQVSGDADLYALIGGRYQINEPVSVGGYAGAGLSGTKSNTKALVNAMVHYTFGGEAGAQEAEPAQKVSKQEKPAQAAAAQPAAVKTEVIDACSLADQAKQLVAKISQKGLEARFAGSASQRMNESAIYFTEAGVAAGSEVARIMDGKQKMVKQQSLPGGAAVRVYVGCDYGQPAAAPKAAPAAPVAPKKEKSAINLAVVNGCGKPGLAEDAAKTLLLSGYNVTQIFDEPKPTTPGLTEVRFREQYKEEAADIAAKLPGRQRLFVDKSLAADVDIRVTIGCEQ